MIRHHHEKLDGSGYPDGIGGDQISTVARIMAVADIYDALATDRPYRKGLKTDEILVVMTQEARQGLIDGKIVDLLATLVEQSSRNRQSRRPAPRARAGRRKNQGRRP